jgi:uncharacterized protein with HEPN domain
MKHRHRSPRLRLEHILKGIARIEDVTAGKTVDDYLADEDLRDIVERNVARIAEAARFIPDDVRTNTSPSLGARSSASVT